MVIKQYIGNILGDEVKQMLREMAAAHEFQIIL